jgi:hypothetical protein
MGQKVVTMEVKLAVMLAAVDARHLTVTAICAELEISRETFYKYRRRFAAEGRRGCWSVPDDRCQTRRPPLRP